jgi:copper(I)-binding protein
LACGGLACHRAEPAGSSFTAGAITVRDVVAPAAIDAGPPDSASLSVYATILNRGSAADSLVAIESAFAHEAMLHGRASAGARGGMTPLAALSLPAGSSATLAPGLAHAMLDGLARYPHIGDSVPVVFIFQHAGRLPVFARVISYQALDRMMPPLRPND